MHHAPDIGFTLEQFRPLLGEDFELRHGDVAVSAVLSEASDLREVQGAGQRSRQFSLVWSAPPEPRLEQRIHVVSHPALGDLELFLVPIAPAGGRMRYEAVFT